MNPTVSEINTWRASPSFTRRITGSSVTNSACDATAFAPVSRLNSVVLPAFVYPTSATVGTSARLRRDRKIPPAPADLGDLPFEHRDPVTDATPVGFQLGFARAARADSAAQARQRLRRSGQARQPVLELRQLDLKLPFTRARPAREDVENQLRAIDHTPAEDLFEVAGLCRRELVVEHHDVDVQLGAGTGDQLRLPAADERRGIGETPLLRRAQDDVGPGSSRQAG